MVDRDARLTALNEIMGGTYGSFERDVEGRYFSMSECRRKIWGIPLDADLSKEKVTVFDLPYGTPAEEVIEVGRNVVATGVPSWSYIWQKNQNGRWEKTFCILERTDRETIRGHIFVTGQNELLGVWVGRLDLKNEVLALDDHKEHYLNRRELQILSLYMDGAPRKEVANELCLSVKSIEKYLARITDKVVATCSPHGDSSLKWCLNHSGLTAFLLEKPDWFADDNQIIWLELAG
ncbi:MAG: hypothetical protein HOC23_12255 [Halieaceae bacterium]|jgi:DNA-binding CsgD family transcriptional regulator|nr:hypothetical protein [Halieaceae bacterium]